MSIFFKVLFGGGIGGTGMLTGSLILQNVILLAAALIICLPLPKIKEGKWMLVFRTVVSAAVLILSAMLLIGSTSHPFLYTRF